MNSTNFIPQENFEASKKSVGIRGPIGALGALACCPNCKSYHMDWDPATDISTCTKCGWNNAADVRWNNRKRRAIGEI